MYIYQKRPTIYSRDQNNLLDYENKSFIALNMYNYAMYLMITEWFLWWRNLLCPDYCVHVTNNSQCFLTTAANRASGSGSASGRSLQSTGTFSTSSNGTTRPGQINKIVPLGMILLKKETFLPIYHYFWIRIFYSARARMSCRLNNYSQ